MTAALRVKGGTGHSAAPLGHSGHADTAMKLDLSAQGVMSQAGMQEVNIRDCRPASLCFPDGINADENLVPVSLCRPLLLNKIEKQLLAPFYGAHIRFQLSHL